MGSSNGRRRMALGVFLVGLAIIATTMAQATAAPNARTTPVHTINAEQMAHATPDQAFRDRLADYLTAEFPEDTRSRTPAEIQEIIAVSIRDCPRLEVCREMNIVIMSIARLRIPDTVASEDFWEAVIEQRPYPNQRAGAFLTEMIVDLDNVDTIAFYRRVNGWSQIGK